MDFAQLARERINEFFAKYGKHPNTLFIGKRTKSEVEFYLLRINLGKNISVELQDGSRFHNMNVKLLNKNYAFKVGLLL